MARRRRFVHRQLVVSAAAVVAVSVAPGPLASGRQDPGARPLTAADLWLQPLPDARIDPAFSRAVDELAAGRAAPALPGFTAAIDDPVLGDYARLYVGRSELALERPAAAAATARQLIGRKPVGALDEAAWWLLADAAEESAAWPEALHALRTLTTKDLAQPAHAHLRLGRVAQQLADTALAREAYRTVHYEYPLSAEAAEAVKALAALGPIAPADGAPSADLARAQRLYAAGRYSEARQAFVAVRPRTSGDDRSLVDLRLAQCDFHLKRHAAARTALDAHLKQPNARVVEAEFYRLGVLRELDRDVDYLAAVRVFADRHGADPLVEAALNDLGTYYILADDDERAAEVFREQYERFPLGAFADRAAWKAGWWAYKQREYAVATRLFESAAAGLRRSDYRPAWLYWAARARERSGDQASAANAHRRVVTDYRNSFYGRQSLAELARLANSGVSAAVTSAGDVTLTSWSAVTPGARPANSRLIQRLLAVGLYDDAILELRRLQRTAGTSPFLDATIGYALHRKGEWRLAITVLRRAYPQFMAAGGERLPGDLLRMIFPLGHWDLIRKYAAERDLDPYLMAALMCQESTFQADVRSPANAWGLMQIVPATGRRYAVRLGIKPFSAARLTDSEVNIRIGMAYFADLRNRFGNVADALAAYNAGENRIVRWRAERPETPLEEFIDDIPFPETQHYVKRVLGTAEDYRILYGPPAGRQASSR
jgi:soluble lytic murein transglycosylase